MPTVHLDKTVFEKLVGKKLPLDTLKDRISMLGTDLDHIEGNEIRVEVFPNRPDMLSEQGFARAFAAFIGTKSGLAEFRVKKSQNTVIVDKNVTMRPYTVCAIAKKLVLNDERIRELVQIQEKLATTHGRNRKRSAYGIYPLENITFPVKYTALKLADIMFRPLGMNTEMHGREILEQHPKALEYKHLTSDWKTYPCFVDSNKRIMSMLPFTNSHDTGKVTTSTTDVFIECSGTDLENVTIALNIISSSLADMGAELYSIDMKYPDKTITTPDLSPRTMTLNLADANRLLGLNLTDQQVTQYLARMGHAYAKGIARVPAYRADILHPVDLIEDIAIAHGYENFEDSIPNVSTIGKESPRAITARKIGELLTGLGMLEVHTYNLSNPHLQSERMNTTAKPIMLKNSVSEEYNCLRAHLLPSIMDVLSHNKHHEYPQHLYTIGTTFTRASSETGIIETDHLALALCHDKADYTQARQVIEYLLTRMGYETTFKATAHDSYIPGRAAHIIVNKQTIGIVGELHPQVITNFNLELPVSTAELDLTFLQG